MQRRAAAVYFVLFVLIGAGAYGFMQVGMSKPTVDLQGETYSTGDEVTINGRTYTVSAIDAEADGEIATYSGDVELAWFNESKRKTATLKNESTIDYDDGSFQVVVPNGSQDAFTLVKEQNVSAILASDPAVENQTVTQNNQKYVVFRDNQSIKPLSDYLPAPETVEFSVGDEFEYQAENVTATIDGVSSSGVAISWSAPGNDTVELGAGENVTVNGVEYFAHFPSKNEVQILPTDGRYGDYNEELSAIQHWEERRNGFWGVIILSVLAAIVLLSTAYMPVKG